MPYRAQVVTSGFLGGPGYNTYHSLAANEAEALDWLEDLETFITTLSGVLANNVNCTFSGLVEQFDPTTGDTIGVFQTDAFTTTGNWGAGNSPGGTAMVFQWRTGTYLNGREIRGRSFISGLGDIGDGTGQVGSLQLTNGRAAAVAYANSPTSAVYSPTNGSLAFINAAGVWNRFGLVRSRRD